MTTCTCYYILPTATNLNIMVALQVKWPKSLGLFWETWKFAHIVGQILCVDV